MILCLQRAMRVRQTAVEAGYARIAVFVDGCWWHGCPGGDRVLVLALESPYPARASPARPDLDDHVAHPASALFNVVLGPPVAGFLKEPPVQEQVVGLPVSSRALRSTPCC